MELTDIIIILDENYYIKSIDWKNKLLKKIYKVTWDTYVNKSLQSIFDGCERTLISFNKPADVY